MVVTNATTGSFKIVYQDKNRNVLAPQRSRGDRIIFSVGEFRAFFDGFNRLFLNVRTAGRAERKSR